MEASEVFKSIEPFTGLSESQSPAPPAVLTDAVAQREIAEVQAAMAIAKRFPRNEARAIDKILTACQRPSLAEKGLYSFSRGGTEISGASVHLLKAVAQQWGNIDFGLKELEQRIGESTVQAFAWDLETNVRETRTFQVGHIRYKRSGTTKLTDPRDIYEMVANLGARRMRACIEGIVPSDVVDLAKEQCEATIRAKADNSPEAIKRMVSKFVELDITREMIETRIQRKLESITPAQIIALRKIYNSLKDGMSKAGDWFDAQPVTSSPSPPAPDKPKRGRPAKPPQAPPEEPEPEQAVVHQPTPEVHANEPSASEGPDLGELLTRLEANGWPLAKLQIRFGKLAADWGEKELSQLADMAIEE